MSEINYQALREAAEAIKMRRLNHQAVSATHCCECGDPIDELRRLAVQGCRTCASCQEDLELISKQRGSK